MLTQADTSEPQYDRFAQAIIWIAGIALTLFCSVGIAAFLGWIPNYLVSPGGKLALDRLPLYIVPPAALKAHKAAAPRLAAVAHRAPLPVAAIAPCADCGVIESVREVEAKGAGSGFGAVAGNEVEKRVKTSSSYEITVRLNDGSSRIVIGEADLPAWQSGDKVRFVNGAIESNA